MGWAGLGWAGAGLGLAGLQRADLGRAETFRALRPRPSGLWGRSQPERVSFWNDDDDERR